MGRENLFPKKLSRGEMDDLISSDGRMVGRKEMLHELDAKVVVNKESNEPIEEGEETLKARSRRVRRTSE